MANKRLFSGYRGQRITETTVQNEAGGSAYLFSDKHALAQYAATGCLNSTFYASADMQLNEVLRFCQEVEPEFIARTAIYAREQGAMKDLPALLCAVLAVRGPHLLDEVFDRVIDSAKMLRNFVQILRSGAVGRKSLGSQPKRLVRKWLASRSDDQLFRRLVFVGSVFCEAKRNAKHRRSENGEKRRVGIHDRSGDSSPDYRRLMSCLLNGSRF